MLQLGFEPTTPLFEGAKTVHALDRAVTVIGIIENMALIICSLLNRVPSSLYTNFLGIFATYARVERYACPTGYISVIIPGLN
jgi:hypothetical protein